MAIPTVDQLLQPTLTALHVFGGTAAIPAITDHVVEALQLSPVEAAERDPRHNMTKVEYRLAWARTYLPDNTSVRHFVAIMDGVSENWTSIRPEGGRIGALAIGPATPGTLYAGTLGGGVFVMQQPMRRYLLPTILRGQ